MLNSRPASLRRILQLELAKTKEVCDNWPRNVGLERVFAIIVKFAVDVFSRLLPDYSSELQTGNGT